MNRTPRSAIIRTWSVPTIHWAWWPSIRTISLPAIISSWAVIFVPPLSVILQCILHRNHSIQDLTHVCTLQSSCGFFLIFKLHKCKVAADANMKDFAVRFKVFFYVSDPSTNRVKIYYKQCFGWSLVSTRLGAIMMPTTFTFCPFHGQPAPFITKWHVVSPTDCICCISLILKVDKSIPCSSCKDFIIRQKEQQGMGSKVFSVEYTSAKSKFSSPLEIK